MNFAVFFNLTNIIKSATCFTKFHSSTIDLFLANKPKTFQKTNVIGTGLSGDHKLICHFLNVIAKNLNQRLFTTETKFNEANFLKNIKNCDFSL